MFYGADDRVIFIALTRRDQTDLLLRKQLFARVNERRGQIIRLKKRAVLAASRPSPIEGRLPRTFQINLKNDLNLKKKMATNH